MAFIKEMGVSGNLRKVGSIGGNFVVYMWQVQIILSEYTYVILLSYFTDNRQYLTWQW